MDNSESATQELADSEIVQYYYADDRDIFDFNKPVPEVPPSPPTTGVYLTEEEEEEEEPQHVKNDSADEPSNNSVEHYWGVVEHLPLVLREISPPPISSPTRLFVSSLTTLVEETSLESRAEDSSDTGLTSEEFEISDRQFSSVGIQTQTSFTDVACPSGFANLSDMKSTSSNSMEPDWEQFVLVEHLEDKTQQEESSSVAIPEAGSNPMQIVVDSLEERLQNRMKNWPRYLQNLMEA